MCFYPRKPPFGYAWWPCPLGQTVFLDQKMCCLLLWTQPDFKNIAKTAKIFKEICKTCHFSIKFPTNIGKKNLISSCYGGHSYYRLRHPVHTGPTWSDTILENHGQQRSYHCGPSLGTWRCGRPSELKPTRYRWPFKTKFDLLHDCIGRS